MVALPKPPPRLVGESTPLTIEHGRLQQLAFYLASLATAGIVLATLNWRNSRVRFLCNAIIIGIGDIPFIRKVKMPTTEARFCPHIVQVVSCPREHN